MNMSGILVLNISDCLYKLRQTYLIELERGKRIRFHYLRTKFLQNAVRTETCLHLLADDVNSGPFSVYV